MAKHQHRQFSEFHAHDSLANRQGVKRQGGLGDGHRAQFFAARLGRFFGFGGEHRLARDCGRFVMAAAIRMMIVQAPFVAPQALLDTIGGTVERRVDVVRLGMRPH